MSNVKSGYYGYYYPYKDETGKDCGLKIMDDVYRNYYKPGYLTDDSIELMLGGKTITFDIPKKSGSGNIQITASIIPYTTKAGKSTKIIKFDTAQDDNTIIYKNAEAIMNSYYKNGSFNYRNPQEFIDKLDLIHPWRTYATNSGASSFNTTLVEINVYRPRAMKNNQITLYGVLDKTTDTLTLVDEAKYKATQAKIKEETARIQAQKNKDFEEKQKQYEEHRKKWTECLTVRNEFNKWKKELKDNLGVGSGTPLTVIADNVTSQLGSINVPNLDDRVLGIVNSRAACKLSFNDIFSPVELKSTRPYNASNITSENYTDTTVVDNLKNKVITDTRILSEVIKINNVRQTIYNELNSSGFDAVTDGIDINVALDLDYFRTARIAFKKGKDAPKYIIWNMFKDVIDRDALKEHILNTLKVYHDFVDMPEQDRKAIAKYVAKHNLSEYYDAVRQFDDVLEVLIDNSRDPKLTKPLLNSIAGTSKADILKDKTYYFEKRGRLRKNVILYKPIDLIDDLRACIKSFNNSSDVAILTNIELDADESFIFQFYTFADSDGDDSGFDGRRMLNLTRIYNSNKPDEKKIGFVFDDFSDEEETN